jgi:hypothetical protein
MTQDLVSSVPGIYTAMLSLIEQAAQAQNPPVQVFPWELGQWEPGSYITVTGVDGPTYEWETIGVFQQRETYEVCGKATVYTGDSASLDSTAVMDIYTQTMNLFQTCVMTPVMSNRTMPLLGTAGPSPFLMLPGPKMGYTGGPAFVDDEPVGWAGVYEWQFHFEAILTPA